MRRGGRAPSSTSGAAPILAPDANFGANLVGWYLPANEGATYVDASSAGNDLTRNGSPTAGSDSDGAYVLHDAGTEYYGSSAFSGIADGAQPFILCVAKQASGGAMVFATLSDDGLDNAGGLSCQCPDATDIQVVTQAEVGASPVNETYQYQHGLDTTALHAYGFGLWNAEVAIMVDGDFKCACDVSSQGNRGGTSTGLTIVNAQDNFRLGGDYAGTTHAVQIYETVVLAEAPTGAQLYEWYRYLKSKYPSLASGLRVDQTGSGVLVFVGQSNSVYTVSGARDGGTTLTQDGTDFLWGRLNELTRPDAIRFINASQGGAAIGSTWSGTSMLRTEATEAAKTAGAAESVTMLWHCGESDASSVPLSTAFQTNFEAVIADIATQSGRDDIQHVVVRLHSEGSPGTMPELAEVQSQMDALAAANDNVTLINLEAAPAVGTPFELDAVHYRQELNRELYARGCAVAYAIYGAATWNIPTHTLEQAFGFRLRACVEPASSLVTIATGISELKHATEWPDWFTQATGTQQPTFNASGGLNNLPYLSYPDASTDMSMRGHVPAANRASIIAIGRLTTGSALQLLCYWQGAAMQIGKKVGSQFKLQANFTGGNQDPAIATPALDAADHVFHIWPLSSGALSQIDGVTTSATYTGSATLTASGGLVIGHGSVAGPNFRLHGLYCIYDLTSAEWFATVVPYLNSRYALSLPTS